MQNNFPNVSPKQSFPALESEVLAYWKRENTFKKSIESRPEDNPYRFYDGPPFITGTPHYGSLLSSIVKDAVGRYWTMRGKRVDRIWGWDCHGLPIEEKVQKKLGLSSNKEIEERGIKEFIDGCYEYTQTTSAEWDWYIDKIGRWVDMDRAYRTMDQDYMESVMWVFKQLWDKGLIYKGKRVSLYSWKLSTPISNFEVAMDDTYQDVNDPAITVKFKLTQDTASANELQKGEFEYTEDGYLRYVLGVVKNQNGEVLQLKSKKFNGNWQIPGGKIDKWETAEEALKREIKEELGVECEIIKKISNQRIFVNKTLWQAEIYEISLLGTPAIQEPHKHEKMEFVKIITDESGKKIFQSETEIITDESIIAKNFDLTQISKTSDNIGKISILAWTTTPWTIPANMALSVGKDIDYVLVKNGDEQFIVAKSRAEAVFKGKGEYEIIRTFKGEELVGISYKPPFDYFYNNQNNDKNHKVYHADFATDTDGTGIVHTAPEFGDVDYQLGKELGLTITEALDDEGKYTSQIGDYAGTHYLDANKINVERMKENGTLFKNESITHRIPFCPRSGTPLVQKAQDSWFIDIQSQKEKLLAANEKINWFPEYLKHGRFAKGIESAPDWCISRTRFWGCPMPVWLSTDGKEQIVVASRDEIFAKNLPYSQLETREVDGKKKYFFKSGEFAGTELNLHRPYIDDILLVNEKNFEAKNILGIHGWKSHGNGIIWETLKNNFGENIFVPNIDENENTNYAVWKAKFDEIDFTKFDTIVAHSLGSPMIVNYILEKKISVKRLILVAPSAMVKNPAIAHIADELVEFANNKKLLKNFAEEIVVIHSKDDDSLGAPFNDGQSIAKEIGANFVAVNGYKHNFANGGAEIVSGIVKHGAPLTRISEVLDVWMDSGSMPYAQMHYPFENKNAMEASFPADFIAEYVGQVRAWFYVMHVLGVLLGENIKNTSEPTPSFTNVITTGVINGNDGRKMSKSYGNYPDPRATIEKYGADPIRFYMLNSPVVAGGDMDFKEEGVVETVKSAMLPIWNTYSFFTTYANIDGWKNNNTEVFFVRHGESESNVIAKISDGTDNPNLTEKGKLQAKNAGEILKNQGINFDVIIHTDRIRTAETGKIIAEEIGFTGEFIIEDGFGEQPYGEYAGKSWKEVHTELGLSESEEDSIKMRKIIKNNSVENVEQFSKRILTTYEKILEKYSGKKILIVGHAGTPRPILAKYHNIDSDKAFYNTNIKNADPFRLLTTEIVNPLDSWILSKLQILIGKVHEAMDGYDISRATRAIVDYMGELTNWYVRLSRRRFWGAEMTADKNSAYETLYVVLVEVSKLLAPYMPFLAEDMFRGLTGRESVHLEYVTLPNPHLISDDLNRDMELAANFVSLGLSLRAKKNIRVRQPLASLTITHDLSDYYKEIIKNELNVKEIIFENPENLAKKICKPDARKIGPKFGKDVQKIIVAAKNGDFTENSDGSILVGEFRLEAGEFVVEYQPLENVGDVEGGYGLVISMDTNLTENLIAEGIARDIIRQIQDMRKEADYQVMDKISVAINGENMDKISDFIEMIENETLSTRTENLENADIEKEFDMEDFGKVKISLKK